MNTEFKWPWVAVLFVLFPFILALGGRVILEEGAPDQERQKREISLQTAVGMVAGNSDPLDHFSRKFRRLERKVFTASEPLRIWTAVLRGLESRYPGMIQTGFVDGNGVPVAEGGSRNPPRSLGVKFITAYRKFLEDRTPFPALVQSFLRSYGGAFLPFDVPIHGSLLYAFPPPKDCYLYLSAPHPQGMFFIFFSPRPHIRDLALSEEVARAAAKGTGIRMSLALSGKSGRAMMRRLGLPPEQFSRLWKAFQASPDGFVRSGNTLLMRRLICPSVWVVGRCDLLPSGARDGRMITLVLSALGLLAIVFLGFGAKGRIVGFLTGSVRAKLLTAFLYSALVPLAIMGLTAQSYLKERREVLEIATHQRMEEFLTGLDRRFWNHLMNLQRSLQTPYLTRDKAPADGFRDFIDRFEDLRSRLGFDSARVFDHLGSLTYSFKDPSAPDLTKAQFDSLHRMARQSFYQMEMEKIAGGQIASAPGRSAGDKVWSDMGVKFEMLFFNQIEAGNLKSFLYSLPLGTPDNRVTHIAFLQWDVIRMQWNYLSDKLAGLSRDSREGRYFAWSPDHPQLSFPRDYSAMSIVAPFLPKVSSTARSFRHSLVRNGETMLLTGIRGTRLNAFSFIGVASDQPIRQEIEGLRFTFGFVTLIIIGVCVIIGMLLADFFLRPIQRLAKGMEAIGERRFDTRIPIDSEDELGAVGGLFNDALADFEDLEIARTVQEHLFPGKAVRSGIWEMFGTCIPASQVGGDFYDFTPLENGTVRLVLGDVAGHGVGAALVVALVKAAFCHPATPSDPVGALGCLNSLMHSILQRKKMMSCCLAALDEKTGTLTMANAGQTWPILIREGKASFLESRGFPLGVARNWKAPVSSIQLMPGDAVIFYTDGLIEAVDAGGTIVGYDRFMSILPSLLGPDATATERAIRVWHRTLSPRNPPEDDVTVLVLQSGSSLEVSA